MCQSFPVIHLQATLTFENRLSCWDYVHQMIPGSQSLGIEFLQNLECLSHCFLCLLEGRCFHVIQFGLKNVQFFNGCKTRFIDHQKSKVLLLPSKRKVEELVFQTFRWTFVTYVWCPLPKFRVSNLLSYENKKSQCDPTSSSQLTPALASLTVSKFFCFSSQSCAKLWRWWIVTLINFKTSWILYIYFVYDNGSWQQNDIITIL